jgi:hypothetical protein
VPPPSTDPAATQLNRLADEMAGLRASVDAMGQRLQGLCDDNAQLRSRLEQSERARGDLVVQCEHLIELLEQTRRELQAARGQA